MPDLIMIKHLLSLHTLVAVSTVAGRKHPVDQYINSLECETSKRTMIQAIARVTDIIVQRPPARNYEENRERAHLCNWAALRFYHLELIKSQLITQVSKTTANKMLAAIRGVMKAARKLRLIDTETYLDIKEVKYFSEKTLPKGRSLTTDELKALALACRADKSPAGRRDAALITVMYGAGLRRAETAQLCMGDWNANDSQLTIRRGKGEKSRHTYLSDNASRILSDWLNLRMKAEPSAPMFTPIDKAGQINERQIKDRTINRVLLKRAEQAGIPNFTPHDLRRSFISDLLDLGADLSAIADLAGHSDVITTSRYDRRGERAKKSAAAKLHVPF